MTQPDIVSRDQWLAAHAELLEREKALTRAHDCLAAARRRLPREAVTKPYEFIGPNGPANLADLFDGRRQLIVYHHMLRPSDPSPCSGCCMFADNIGHLAHLNARNTTLVLVSRAPAAEIEAFRHHMGWAVAWYESSDDFNTDFGVTGGFGINVFFNDGDALYRTYFTSGRGVEMLGSTWSFLDLTPLGRQELWENSPEHIRQTPPYQWWRLHDEYKRKP